MDIGAYTPDDAKYIKDAVTWLRQSGFDLQATNRRRANSIDAAIHLVKNISGEDIPPYACMQVTGTERLNNRTYHLVEKPKDINGDNGWYLFNTHETIADEKLGNGLDGPLVRARSEDTTFDAGDNFQPIVDSWYIEKVGGSAPFIGAGVDRIKDYEDVIKVFIQGGGGGCELMVFTVDDVYGTETASSDHCDDQLNDAKDKYLASCVRACCGGKPSGADEDGKYLIHDLFDMFQGGIGGAREQSDIIGRQGLAIRFSDCDNYEECLWYVIFVNWFRTIQVITNVRMTDDELIFERKNVEVWDDCELDPITIALTDCEEY